MVLAVAAGAFSATPAGRKVISRMRAAARALVAIQVDHTGDLVYCPGVPEGWTYAPETGCWARADVTETYDLSRGHIERIVGHVSAGHLPTLTYVADSSGWYQATAGSGCWTETLFGFVAASLVDYPLPAEHVSVLTDTRKRIVLEAVSRPDAYTEFDYVDPKTMFMYRDVEITRVRGTIYRVFDRAKALRTRSPRPATSPLCAPH
jgi:hypothetical protein